MTARHITARWERVAVMLHACKLKHGGSGSVKPLTLWLAMLYVANGTTSAPELVQHMKISLSLAAGLLRLLRLLSANGLAVCCGKQHLHNSRPRTLWAPTPKLYAVLGVKPSQTESGVAA